MTSSAFEILGPIMVGPSSSHTAGALRIALVARSLAASTITHARFTLYNSFARTFEGHGTNRALVAGLLGLTTDDARVKDSFELASAQGLSFEFIPSDQGFGKHPNTVCIEMHCQDGQNLSVTGESLGGGRIRIVSIDGVSVEISGDYPTLFVSHFDRVGVLARITSEVSQAEYNIASMRTYRSCPAGAAYSIFETDAPIEPELRTKIEEIPNVRATALLRIPGVTLVTPGTSLELNFTSGGELLTLCQQKKLSIGKLMREREYELMGERSLTDQQMKRVCEVMRASCTEPISNPQLSMGGLIGGQAHVVSHSAPRLAPALMGEALSRAVAWSMAVLERSASMGVIVAAPTAGSAGVVPGVLLSSAQTLGASQEQLEEALWNAAAIGAIVVHNASVAGAEGGCQAEVGSAAAMAASGLVELMGGTPQECLCAAAIAIGNLLGLVCDPVRGLVEYPCQNRNAIGACAAVSSAQLSLAGVGNPIPFDEVVAAMHSIGKALPETLRETALGGLAAAPSAAQAVSACATCPLA